MSSDEDGIDYKNPEKEIEKAKRKRIIVVQKKKEIENGLKKDLKEIKNDLKKIKTNLSTLKSSTKLLKEEEIFFERENEIFFEKEPEDDEISIEEI